MPFDIGSSVPLAWDVRNAAGVLTNAADVDLTITLPDGTAITPAVTNPPASTGEYREIYVPVAPGRYAWGQVSTNPNTAYGGVFTVREAVSPSVLSLADAKAHLNITSTTQDDELREYLESATAVIEEYVGPIVRRTHTRQVTGGRQAINLPHTQVLEVTAVDYARDGAEAIAAADVLVNTDAGVITRVDCGYLPYGELAITYTVGRSYVKPNWTLAAKMIVAHNWESQLGNLPSIQGDDPGYVVSGSGYLVPYRALALLHPDEVPVGFA
jgi:hypothetical protein